MDENDPLKAFFPPGVDMAVVREAVEQLSVVIGEYDLALQKQSVDPGLRTLLVRDLAQHILSLGQPK